MHVFEGGFVLDQQKQKRGWFMWTTWGPLYSTQFQQGNMKRPIV